MKIQITKPANDDLQEIDRYIRIANPSAAARTVMRVMEAIEYLGVHPNMGRNGRVLKTKELIVSGTELIVIYQLRQQTIFILRILHAARKWP